MSANAFTKQSLKRQGPVWDSAMLLASCKAFRLELTMLQEWGEGEGVTSSPCNFITSPDSDFQSLQEIQQLQRNPDAVLQDEGGGVAGWLR